MNARIFTALLVAVAGSLAAACGSNNQGDSLPDPGPSSGLDGSQRVTALTPAQQTALCDWTAGRSGGWSRTHTCSNGDYFMSRQSESLCVMDFATAGPSCSATVGDVEDCVNGVVQPGGCQALPGPCFSLALCALH
jgi:hypothetical protein